MNLKTYIDQKGEAHVAVAFNVSVWTVRSWRQGTRKPRAKKANEIVARTGGEVSLADIYAPALDCDRQDIRHD
jgi:hypothetical protein